jgi:hypothetical protein
MMRILAFLLLAILPAFGQPANPFTVIDISRRIDVSGKPEESRFLFAMNRDGSIACIDLDPASGGVRQILDAVKRRSILVNPNARSVTMSRWGGRPESSDQCEQRFRSIDGSLVSVDRSAGEIQGVSLQRISVSLPDGSAMEILVAPSLACHMIQAQTSRNGTIRQTKTVQNLQLGDPDPRLFEVPAAYQVTEAELPKR